MAMTIYINDEPTEVETGCTVAALVEQQWPDRPKGIAVAVDNEVVSRDRWKERQLREHARLIIITATQGG